MTIRRFYALPANVRDQGVTLDEGETRHLRDVLRLVVGETVRVFDGRGREYECRVERIGKREAGLSLIRETDPTAPESPLDLTICAAVLKSDKTDFAVQKCVELGVNKFVPILTARTDVRPRDADRRVERWRKIVLEATKQCGRTRLMQIETLVPLSEALRSAADRNDQRLLFFSERDGGKLEVKNPAKSITAFLGPEGGWRDEEIDAARKARAEVITFGGRIMKADTAAVAISAILQHHCGDLN